MTTREPRSATRRVRLKPSDRRASIVERATAAFAARGFRETPMVELADAVGVTPVIIYRHFDSKDSLYRAVLSEIADRYRDHDLLSPSTGGLTIDVARVLQGGREDSAGFRLFWHHAVREPEFNDLPTSLRSEAVDLLSARLGARADEPQLTQWAAQAAVGYVIESVLTWLEFGDPTQDQRFCAATTAAMKAGVKEWSTP